MIGRPSKYDSKYCDDIIAHMSEGASVTSFAAEINVARSTINEWMAAHPEFSEAVSRAKAKCAAWWEKTARANAQSGLGNPTLCVFGLKNMGSDDWAEKSQTEHSGSITGRVIHVPFPKSALDE